MSTIPKEALGKIKEKFPVETAWNVMDTSGIKRYAAEWGYQLAADGRESFWTEEMILRYAELYRWSSGRITMKGLKESKEWQTASIHAAKEIAKQIDDGREELEKEVAYIKDTLGDCRDYMDDKADVDVDNDYFVPNKEAKLLSRIDSTIEKLNKHYGRK